jgi:Rv2258c-like winged HTH domain
MTIDEGKLHEFLGRFVGDLGATVHAANVVIGDKLGLYKTLATLGPSTSQQLADSTSTHPRYIAEWLAGQAAGDYISYDPNTARWQEVGAALGAQAGEARLRQVLTEAGFRQFRRAAETPFNDVYEARR